MASGDALPCRITCRAEERYLSDQTAYLERFWRVPTQPSESHPPITRMITRSIHAHSHTYTDARARARGRIHACTRTSVHVYIILSRMAWHNAPFASFIRSVPERSRAEPSVEIARVGSVSRRCPRAFRVPIRIRMRFASVDDDLDSRTHTHTRMHSVTRRRHGVSDVVRA